MKKKLVGITLAMILSMSGNMTTMAEGRSGDQKCEEENHENMIPMYMLPNSVIEYVNDSEFRIIQGGIADEMPEYVGVKERARKDLMEKENVDIDKLLVGVEDPMKPEKGLVVNYADDGQILSLTYSTPKKRARVSSCANCGNAFITGSPEVGENYMWGGVYGNNNILYGGPTTVYGYGRFTNFTDTYGQANHRLKKGDVATRGHVDNPKTGTIITCEAPVNGTGKRLKVTMQKWDIGCMPNAVLDIWYTGVEKWGYAWSSSLSINDGYYEYSR